MSKQIIYDEPYFDPYTHANDNTNITHYEVSVQEEEYEAVKKMLEERGCINIAPKDLPPTIDELKAELAATDYKIIKCSEYRLAGLDMPYDVAELNGQRQALRDQINESMEVSFGN